MHRTVYRYSFRPEVALEDVEASLLLAVLATESLHGESQVRLDASYYLDAERRACVIDAGTPVGQDVNRLFVGFVRREYGEDVFTVQRVAETPAPVANASESASAAMA